MKKNAMLKIAAILMVAVLLTTCAISSTFAKYTTSDSKTVSAARVAHFGYTVTATVDDDFFADSYSKTVDETETVYVNASGTTDVLAPGTQNLGAASLSIASANGAAEVPVKVTVNFDLTLENWTVADSAFYCPVDFYVGETMINGSNYTSATALEDAIVAAVQAAFEVDTNGEKNVGIGVDYAKSTTFGWKWDLTGNNDTNDTILGNAATKATIGFNFGATVEQVGVNNAEPVVPAVNG